MQFIQRTTEPARDNDCYYSNKNALYRDGYGMPNCTCYSLGRWIELLGYAPNLCLGNAGRWYNYTQDGYQRGSTPKYGAIAVWGLNGSDVDGHVAIVEGFGDGYIDCSNSAYQSTNFYMKRYEGNYNFPARSGTYIFKGFIYPPVDFELNVARANITSFNADVTSRSMTLNFETDLPVDWAKYQTDGLGFADLPVGSVIEGLTPNTTYNVAIQLRTQGSNEWVTSNTIQVTTLDEPVTLKFNKGDKVKVNGPLFNKATADGMQGVNVTNYIDTISLIYDHYDAKHPYNIGDNHIGWVDESSLELYVEPTPTIPTPNEENNTTQNTQETTNTTTNGEEQTNTQSNQENCSQAPNNTNNGNNSLINTLAITLLLILALIWNFIKQFWILIIIVIVLIVIIKFLLKEKTKK